MGVAPPTGKPPSDALTVGEAVRLYTSDAAYATFADDCLGRAPGPDMLADLTVLEGKLTLDDKEPVPTDLSRAARSCSPWWMAPWSTMAWAQAKPPATAVADDCFSAVNYSDDPSGWPFAI